MVLTALRSGLRWDGTIRNGSFDRVHSKRVFP
jgi:hypothetical protein